MLNIFLKDMRAGALFLWAVVPLDLVTALQLFRFGAAFFWANVALAAFTLAGVAMLEWRNGAESFVHSLPVNRAAVVRGRYLTAVAVGLITLLVAAAAGVGRGVGLAVRGEAWPRWVAGDMAFAFLLAFALVAAVYLPCHFRWGFSRGNVAAALLLAVGIIVGGLAGDAADALLPARAAVSAGSGVPVGLIPQGVARMADAWGPTTAGVVTLVLAAALLWLSSCVAVIAYRRQEF